MRQFDLNLVHVLIQPKAGILTKIDIKQKLSGLEKSRYDNTGK
jgi:hypothetical protein